jgi:hypothetical protein
LAAGDSIKEVTSLNREEADEAYLWPESLPGGAMIFTILSWEREPSRVAIQEPDGAPQSALIEEPQVVGRRNLVLRLALSLGLSKESNR